MCAGVENWLQHNYGPAIPYAETILIAGSLVKLDYFEDGLCASKEHRNFGLEAAKIIELLPTRFDNMKVSFYIPYPDYIDDLRYPARRIDSLLEYLSRTRPDFIFDVFHVDRFAMKEITNAAEVQDYLMSHAKVLDISSWESWDEPL